MKAHHVRRLIVVCTAVIVLYSVGIWQWGFPYIVVNYSQSIQAVPHEIPWTDLGWAVFFEEGEAKVLELIHKDPAQLTMPQSSSGGLPLDFALTDGNSSITALLLFEIEGVYEPEYLLKVAKRSIRLQKFEALSMLRSVVPTESADWYHLQLEGLLQQAGLDDIGTWPTEAKNTPAPDQVP